MPQRDSSLDPLWFYKMFTRARRNVQSWNTTSPWTTQPSIPAAWAEAVDSADSFFRHATTAPCFGPGTGPKSPGSTTSSWTPASSIKARWGSTNQNMDFCLPDSGNPMFTFSCTTFRICARRGRAAAGRTRSSASASTWRTSRAASSPSRIPSGSTPRRSTGTRFRSSRAAWSSPTTSPSTSWARWHSTTSWRAPPRRTSYCESSYSHNHHKNRWTFRTNCFMQTNSLSKFYWSEMNEKNWYEVGNFWQLFSGHIINALTK